MDKVSIIGIDIAKNVFHSHGASSNGAVVFRKALTRSRVLEFLSRFDPCLVAMEACASAHYWGREIAKLGHKVRLIPPQYVKPFVKRQKNDAADAEAIVEAVLRPSMRFVSVKSAEQQGQAMVLKTRDLFTAQRTQAVNALRGHLAEYGVIAPTGLGNLTRHEDALDDPKHELPEVVVALCRRFFDRIDTLSMQINDLTRQVKAMSRKDDTARRLTTIPGIGPICSMALATLAPPSSTFAKGRDFSAWAGLTPRQHSTGGKTRLGRTSKMGQRDIRRLLIIGAMSVIQAAERQGGAPDGSWLARMLTRKPKMLVAVALANKMARTAWALMTKGEVYRVPLAA